FPFCSVLWVFLLCILMFHWSPKWERQCYKKFINQHINQGMSQTRCDNVMRTRQITESTSNQCKETNTFILAGTNEVKKVCRDAGAPYQNKRDMRVSTTPFPVVNCKQRNKRLNNRLAFLDCDVSIGSNGQLQTEVYRKPTHADQYLLFDSNHLLQHKLGVIRTLQHRTSTYNS
uniref:Ribonuclease A-domain domain-containing protein n=1 Tax=Neogobius melanostomus TaxID=47308 RepID=A0A8C6TVG8_9GOBI